MTIVMANYTSKFSFSNHVPHFEQEEVLGFAKQPANCPLGVNNDFHHLDYVNFSHPRIIILAPQPNIVGDVSM
jgi:hypothetical protein